MAFENDLRGLLATIRPLEPAWIPRGQERLDSLTKPPGSLGRLEALALQACVVQQSTTPTVAKKAIVLMAADHGVVAQGVSPYPQEVTAQMVANFLAGGAAINQLAGLAGADLVLVDIGVASELPPHPALLDRRLAAGTADMSLGPAMDREVAAHAIMIGAQIAQELADAGVGLIGTGEMGIGNTTAASAITAAVCQVSPELVVGPGTGLDEAGVARKAAIVSSALSVNNVDVNDPLGLLAGVGGLEIAGLVGVILGAASAHVCVVADGFISGAAALVAAALSPEAPEYLFPSHRSAEPGHVVQLEALGLEPVLELDMRLGEGTGAALAMTIIEAGCRCMGSMATFARAGVSEESAGDHALGA